VSARTQRPAAIAVTVTEQLATTIAAAPIVATTTVVVGGATIVATARRGVTGSGPVGLAASAAD
jgi:hypothetical protein